jgi:hypothetical protein
MAKQSTKHPNQFTISLQNIMQGLCLIANPESIPDGTVAQMDNWEYGVLLSQPQVCPGVELKYNIAIDAETLFYDAVNDIWYCSSGTSLYSTNLATKTLLGTLTGSYKPIYALYDNIVLVASGGQIQKIASGTTLTTIAGSPLSHYVAHNNGRVEAFNIFSDVKNYSAIGDYNGWVNVPADISSSQFVQVGYKDASQIACSIKLATDSIVIKKNGSVYRVLNENNFSNIGCVPAAQKIGAFNHYSGLSLMNKAFFIGFEGFNSFSTVTDYGGVKVDDPSPGYMINGWYVNNADSNTRLWHVSTRKQIWCKTSNANEILIYHYSLNAWSKRQFKYPIHDVVVKGFDVYIAYGTKIAKINDNLDTDDGDHYTATIASKRYLPKHKKYLMKYINLITYNFIAGNYILNVGNKVLPVSFINSSDDPADTDSDPADTDSDPADSSSYTVKKKFTRKRATSIQVVMTVQTGRLALRDMSIDVAEIGR